MIFEHAIPRKAAPLLRGYVRGMVNVQRTPTAHILALFAKLESTHPDLAVEVLGIAGDSFDAFNRILHLLDSQAVSPRYLAYLAMGLGRRQLTPDEVNKLLPYFIRAATTGDADTALAGVRFLVTFLHFDSRHTAETCLRSEATRSLSWQLLESVLPCLTGHHGADWGEIVKKLASFDPERAARVFGHALLSDSPSLQDQAERHLSELATEHADFVMTGFGLALLDPEQGWRLQIHICRDLVAHIPPQVVLAWVRSHGLDGARAIAPHLPVPYLDNAGNPVVPELLDTIMREYDDDKVAGNFYAGSHSGATWWGNGGGQFRRSADQAKKFLTHPNRRIQEWAQYDVDHQLQMAELEEREHEERFLPS